MLHCQTMSHLSSAAGREYSKADSRYASRDPFVVSMEAITAFVEGPLCFLAVWGLIRRSSWRYTVIIIVSLGQLYGDVLYFATTILEGVLPWSNTCYLAHVRSVSWKHNLNHAASHGAIPLLLFTHKRARSSIMSAYRLPAQSSRISVFVVLFCIYQQHLDSRPCSVHCI